MKQFKLIFLVLAFSSISGVLNAQKRLPIVKWNGPTPAAEQEKPGFMEEVFDPVYSAKFKKIADSVQQEKDRGELHYVNKNTTKHYYSLRPVFNRNSSLYLLNWQQIRRVDNNELIGDANALVPGKKFDNAVWSKVDTAILYGTISKYFVALNVITRVVDTIVELEGFNTGPNDRLYMDNQQAIAGADEYIVISDVPTLGKQIKVVDIQNRTILSTFEDVYSDTVFTIAVTDKTETDSSIRMNVGISQSGEYIAIGGGNGGFLYDKYFNYIRPLANHSHADYGIDIYGNDVLVSLCPAKYEVLATGEVHDLLGGTYACGHSNSSANYLQPGWAYFSVNKDDNDRGDNGITLGFEILAVQLDPEGKTVRKIVHPHNTGHGIYTSALGVPNADGTLLMFNSAWDNFGPGEDARIEAYMVELATSDSSNFTLEINGQGEITSSNSDTAGIEGYYYTGYIINLTATDTALGYAFSNWSGDIESTDNPLKLKLDSDNSIIANFVEVNVFTLTTEVDGEGRVSSKSNGNYNEGTDVIIKAFPQWGYEFLGWAGDYTGTENPATIKMDSNINITAKFSGGTGIDENGDHGFKSYPNPFSKTVTFQYELANTSKVKLSVVNMAGQTIAVLIDSKQNPGIHKVKWNSINEKLSNGIYISKFEVENGKSVYSKLILNK